jgi:D-xylose transport system permease protein
VSTEAAPAFDIAPPDESLTRRTWENIKGGNLGSAPVILGLAIIVLVFALTAQNFFTPVNLNNIIVQMSGTTMLAFGVVFVLLIGEIDLSIAYLSGVAGVLAAELQKPDSGHMLPGVLPIVVAIAVAALLGAFQGSFVATIGVPAFVVTLAGLLAWQGVIQVGLGAGGPIIIQNRWINYTANYFFSPLASWLIAAALSLVYLGSVAGSVVQKRRHGVAIRYPLLVGAKAVGIPALTFLVVWICTKDRGVPLAGLEIVLFLLFWTYVAKRTTFGRHVYAVGGNAEAARRAGINVTRIRILVFALSSAMAAVSGIAAASRLASVDAGAGGGNTLLYAVAAAVIGGTSLFGGRGRVRDALLGGLVIAIIANGLGLLGVEAYLNFIITGGVLLLAASVDAIARRRAAATGH